MSLFKAKPIKLLLLLHLLQEQMQRAQEELQSNSYPEESVASLKLKCLLRKMQHLHALSRVFAELSHRAWLGSAHACLGQCWTLCAQT
jgi:hypothetical protein